MTIQEIKSQLNILEILDSYGIRPNSNNMIACPFHADKKPSMKVYPKTNTVYCFAGSCEVNNLDAIDFIMEMDKSDKHLALIKAKNILVPTTQKTTSIMRTAKSKTATNSAAADFTTYQKSLKTKVQKMNQNLKKLLDDR